MHLSSENPVSKFAFKCNLYRYTADEIQKAYRELVSQIHPDKNSAPGAEDACKKVNNACDVLSDASMRMEYDNAGFGAGGFQGGGL